MLVFYVVIKFLMIAGFKKKMATRGDKDNSIKKK